MSGLRLGPGAPSGYPFSRRVDAESAPALLDLQVTFAVEFSGDLFLVSINPLTRSLSLVSGDGAQVINLDSPAVVVVAGNHYWQWYEQSFSVRATVNPAEPGYTGSPLSLCVRVIDFASTDVGEIVFETLDGDVSSKDKPLKMRGGYNTEFSVDGSSLDVAVAPGNGEGTLQNCSEDALAIRSIAGGPASSNGNFLVTSDDCFRIQPELRGDGDTRTVVNGSYYLHDDCEACCRCEEKAAVWRLAKEMQDRLIPMVGRYQELRRIYNERVSQINKGNDCSTRPLLNADLVNIDQTKAQLYISVCNGTTETLEDVVISVSPLYVYSGTLFKYSEVDIDFFTENKGVIQIPDNDTEFYSLPEQLRRARHMDLDTADLCNHGYAYSIGSKEHLKFPGEVLINKRAFDPSTYRIFTSLSEEGKLFTKFFNDGGFDFSLHCIEPGDTRYFSVAVGYKSVAVDFVDGRTTVFTGPNATMRDARNVALIVHSPSHPEINFSIKMGTGGVLPCDPDITEEEEA